MNGSASFTTSSLAAGTHFITATHDATGVAVTRVQKIHRSATSTVVSLSGSTRFTALVFGHAGGTPTGMVTFLEGSRVLAQVPLTSERTATVTLADTGAATRTIVATYASDPAFAASTGVLTYPDTTPPATPIGLAAAPGPNAREVTLTWQPGSPANEVVEAVIYEIWRDPPFGGGPKLVGASILPTYVDVWTRGPRLARYFVVAVDGTGNRSARSAIVWSRAK